MARGSRGADDSAGERAPGAVTRHLGWVANFWTGDAPAKVNLLLRVLERGEDGYHRIETVLHALELADTLRLDFLDGDSDELELEGVAEGALGPPEANLAVRAAEGFRRVLATRGTRLPGIRVHLSKRIPHGAGLGGGSSDAAAVLRGLNTLLEEALPQADLMRLGAGIGSDVPFFVSGAARAVAWGRGERVLELPALPPRDVLLAVPEPPISTDWAYGVLASRRAREREAPARPRFGYREGPGPSDGPSDEWAGVRDEAQNDFEEALFPLRPEFALIKAALLGAGGGPALLCGSGAAVFGVFDDQDALERGASAVGGDVRVLRTRTSVTERR